MTINIYWLFLIIPVSVIIGFILAFFYLKKVIEKQMLKMTGFKSMEDLFAQMKKIQEFQKKMNQGDISGLMSEINKDPKMKKQLEELRKKFGGDK